jgi:hypothetical protein
MYLKPFTILRQVVKGLYSVVDTMEQHLIIAASYNKIFCKYFKFPEYVSRDFLLQRV